MRATVAKRIRRNVYGKDFSPRARDYTEGVKTSQWYMAPDTARGKIGNLIRKWFKVSGVIKADFLRRQYQDKKRAHSRGPA